MLVMVSTTSGVGINCTLLFVPPIENIDRGKRAVVCNLTSYVDVSHVRESRRFLLEKNENT